jgi:hypothetical protein
MPLSLLELAWLDIWPGLVGYSFMPGLDMSNYGDCLLGSRLHPVSIPFPSRLHSFHLYAHSDFRFRPHSRSLVAPVFVPIPIPAPAPCSLRFSLPWFGLGWPGPGRGPGRRCVLAAPFREAISLAKRYRFAVNF